MTRSPLGRVVEIASEGHYLSKERGFLKVGRSGEEAGSIALDDIAAVIATTQATSVSCALLAELGERGIPFIVCGPNYAPSAMLWPAAAYHAQQRRMQAQIAAAKPLKKQLWAKIIQAKIMHQAFVLQSRGKEAAPLFRLAADIRSGDPENFEARAARNYWPLAMGQDFRRDTKAQGANALLNYGYAVLRAATSRALAGAGLHPGIGIFHCHPQNPAPLADDMMEPFRPFTDLAVCRLLDQGITEVTPDAKRQLVAVLTLELPTEFGLSPLATCLHRLAASLGNSFEASNCALDLPILPWPTAMRAPPRKKADAAHQ
jgi:CRISPR-associated protein Cas1